MIPHEIARIAYEKHGASQRVGELAQAVALVAELGPRVVVEIGCDRGGTLWCWRQLCDDVYGITLPHNDWAGGGQEGYPLHTHGASVFLGDSHHPEAAEWLQAALQGRPVDVLHIDGDHSYAGVRADWATYSPLVRPGGLVLLHDICNHRDVRVDVPDFWADLTITWRGRVIANPQNPLGFGVITIEETTHDG